MAPASVTGRILLSIAAVAAGIALGAAAGILAGEKEPARKDLPPFEAVAGSRTWIPSLSGDRTVLWAVGDGADGGEAGEQVGEMIAGDAPGGLLYLGDVYESGTAAEFEDFYETAFGSLKARTAPVLGNHEWANRASGYLPYWEGVHGEPAPRWYSFDASGWQLIALDSNTPADRAQLSWLETQIGVARFGSCRLAFAHHPRFSASTEPLHGDNPSQQPLWERLVGRVTLVVNAHDHTMQRLRPVAGSTELISGAGGHELYPLAKGDPRLAFSESRVGALRLTLRPGRASAAFVATDGAVLDRSSYRCTPGA